MSDPTTPNLGLSKPVVNADADTWGTTTNADWDILDAAWGALLAAIAPKFIAGLTLSTAGGSATFAVSAGSGGDASGALMTLAASISKTTGSWTVGSTNGALDSGAIADSTWYHVFLIKRVDTSVVDILVSLSATSPAVPTNYTLSRRIGAMKTDGSAHWTAFTQVGDEFVWGTAVQDYSNNPTANTLTPVTVNVPLGVNVVAHMNGFAQNISATVDVTLNSVFATNLATNDGTANFRIISGSQAVSADVLTNTSAQVQLSVDVASTLVRLAAVGWRDFRGKN